MVPYAGDDEDLRDKLATHLISVFKCKPHFSCAPKSLFSSSEKGLNEAMMTMKGKPDLVSFLRFVFGKGLNDASID